MTKTERIEHYREMICDLNIDDTLKELIVLKMEGAYLDGRIDVRLERLNDR